MKELFLYPKSYVHNTLLACPIRATVISWSFKILARSHLIFTCPVCSTLIPVTMLFSSTIDGEFKPVGNDSDDEETIDVEERQAAKAGEVSGPSEIELLQRESELPIEELLTSLQETQAKDAQGSEVKQEEKPSKDKPDVSLKMWWVFKCQNVFCWVSISMLFYQSWTMYQCRKLVAISL